MTPATKRRPTGARSTKVRPHNQDVPYQHSGSFPPPTKHSEDLIVANMPLARAMAHRQSILTKMPYDDLYLTACEGLIKGCRRYDPDLINPATGKSYALSTILVPYIRGAMLHWLRDKGHSSGVKFPDRWRDIAPTVRKMANNGSTIKDIHEVTSLPLDDIEGILQAQRPTTLLDPDIKNNLTTTEVETDELDEAEFYDELAWALHLADQAYNSLAWSEKIQIESSWSLTSRGGRKLASQQHRQFLIRSRRIAKGLPCPTEEQAELSMSLPVTIETKDGPKVAMKKLSKPKEIIEAIEQLSFLHSQPP